MLARASQLLRPRQAGREVTPACASSPRRQLLAASPLDALDDLHVVAPTAWTRPFFPNAYSSPSPTMADATAAAPPT